jgi:hypothetical protein
MAVFFNGQLLVTPTTASAVNDDAMVNRNLSVGNAVAFVGKSLGGKPKEVLEFGSPEEAIAVLRGGELLDAVKKAFAPSVQVGSPGTVRAIRVNPATQSTLALQNATPATVITLTSENYGQEDNRIKVKVEAGTDFGKRITVQKGSEYYTKDNIGREAFSCHYTGAEATATISITGTTVTLAAPAGTTIATIALADFDTIGELVDRINTVASFTAEVLDNSENRPSLNGLDYVTTLSVKTEATLRADLQAIVDWFNTSVPLVDATRAAGVGSLPANIPFTYLAGGSEGTTTNTDWSDAFEVLQTADVQWIAPISGDSAIRAMADTHAHFCSNTLRRERRVISGTAEATTDDAAIAAAKELNSDRTSLVHIGYYDYDANGALKLYPPYMTAALLAAMFAGVNPGTALTNKTMSVRGLERKLRNPTDTDQLINGGVLCVEETEAGYKVVQSISTWRGNSKYNRREQSTGAALDFTVRNVRNAVDILRGEKNNPILLSRANSITQSTLRELARNEPEGPGVLAGDAENPAYRNISASIEGDVLRIQFECSPVIPANYILVTVYAVPYSGTLAA